MQTTLLIDEHRFTGRHIADRLEGEHVERDALGGQHEFRTFRGAPGAEHQRTDAIRIAKAQHAVADDHNDHRVAAATASVHRTGRRENVRRGHARRADALQLGGEYVQQHFRIRFAVEMAPILADQHLRQFGGVGQVAVVRQADAIGCVHEERLRLRGSVATGGRIAHVADTDLAGELEHVLLFEDVAHEARAFARAQAPLEGRHDARGVLTAMLQHRQRVIESLVDRSGAHNADDAAHVWYCFPGALNAPW